MYWLWLKNLNCQDPRTTYFVQYSCLRYLSYDVFKCDYFNKTYPRKVKGGLLLAPNMNGKYEIINDVGPEYLKLFDIQELTNEEANDILKKDLEEKNYF